jgi:hypothetical protein
MTLKIDETQTLPGSITLTNKYKRYITLDKDEQKDVYDYLAKKYPLWGVGRMNTSLDEAFNTGDGRYTSHD